MRRDFGTLGGEDGRKAKNQRQVNRQKVPSRQVVDGGAPPGAGKYLRPALLAGVFGLAVWLLAGFWLFLGADTKDVAGAAKQVEPQGKNFSRRPASPAPQVAGRRQGSTTEPVLLVKKIITPPITAYLPVPKPAESGDKITTRQATENKAYNAGNPKTRSQRTDDRIH